MIQVIARALLLASTALLRRSGCSRQTCRARRPPTARHFGPTATSTPARSRTRSSSPARSRPERKIDTSISISSVNAETIGQIQPQSAADLIRFIPGIRSEASGGEGNANISVRGLPVASGGAKFIQFQEDGIPVLLFGDISFGTADTFVKADNNIARVEGGPRRLGLDGGGQRARRDPQLHHQGRHGRGWLGRHPARRRLRHDAARLRLWRPSRRRLEVPRRRLLPLRRRRQGRAGLITAERRPVQGQRHARVRQRLHPLRPEVPRRSLAGLSAGAGRDQPQRASTRRTASIPGFNLKSGALQSPAYPELAAVARPERQPRHRFMPTRATAPSPRRSAARRSSTSAAASPSTTSSATRSTRASSSGRTRRTSTPRRTIANGIGGAGSTVTLATGPNAAHPMPAMRSTRSIST